MFPKNIWEDSDEEQDRKVKGVLGMKLCKVAVLPMGIENWHFQESLNLMINQLFIEGWEFDKIILAGRRTLVVFSKQKENKIPEEKVMEDEKENVKA